MVFTIRESRIVKEYKTMLDFESPCTYNALRCYFDEGRRHIMAIPTNIHTLLSGSVVEWARIEFKESWKPEASLKTITAFANDLDNWGGGYLVLGVEDDNGRPKLPIKGLKLSEVDDVLKDLLNKCKMIEPEYLPIVAPVDYDEHTKLIVVWCPGGAVRPYRSPAPSHTKKGRPFPPRRRFTGFGKCPAQSSPRPRRQTICLPFPTRFHSMTESAIRRI